MRQLGRQFRIGAPSEFSFAFPDMTNDLKRLSFTLAIQRGRSFTFQLRLEFVATNISFRPKP